MKPLSRGGRHDASGGVGGVRTRLRHGVGRLRRNLSACALAARHPCMPWLPRILAVVVIAYAASPIDLIPDFIPVLGLLDDVVLVPLGLWLVLRLTPPALWAECQARAAAAAGPLSPNWIAAACVIALWLGTTVVGAWYLYPQS